MASSLAFNWLLKSFGNGRYTPPPDSHEHSYHGTHDRTNAARPIALAHVPSDHLITRAILSHYRTTLTFILLQSHLDARYIAKFNAFASYNGRFRWCEFRTNTFSYAIISATVYDPNLNFLVARIFCCFCSRSNCERAFRDRKHFTLIVF